MSSYVIIGRGGAYQAILETLGLQAFRGFYDDQDEPEDPHWLGRLSELSPSPNAHFIGLGAIRNMLLRAQLIERLARHDLPDCTSISSGIFVSPSARIGNGCVATGVGSVGTNVVIGSHGLLFSGLFVEHDVRIGNNVNIGPGVILSGKVEIGDNVFLGAGTVIADGVSVGSNSVVGAGSLVLDSIPPNVIAFGRPARPVRANDLYPARAS